ncbi:hypothetical protein OG352_23095 [Streptomyces sp. NBC_01485]|uniref:hypothetical protein n=1 Tax=Streptomyces sp. NBC_01485 TaxID=2903884 RepID=UPI002E335386|nr:hypothetical protein [Streptomyces sp. NBC_01485]
MPDSCTNVDRRGSGGLFWYGRSFPCFLAGLADGRVEVGCDLLLSVVVGVLVDQAFLDA